MSSRNIDNITNITLEKCSCDQVIYNRSTLSPVSKTKLLIRNLWNKQCYLLESVTADRQKYLAEQQRSIERAICSHSAIKSNGIPVWWGSSTFPAALVKQLKKEQASLQRKGVVTSAASTVWICLQTVVAKFCCKTEIGTGSEMLVSEEHWWWTASEGLLPALLTLRNDYWEVII